MAVLATATSSSSSSRGLSPAALRRIRGGGGASSLITSSSSSPATSTTVVSSSSLSLFSFPSSSSSTVYSAATATARRAAHAVTTAANFDTDIIQSQQAICLVYHVPNNSSCAAFLRTAERVCDGLNAEAAEMMAEQHHHDADSNNYEDEDDDGVGVVVENGAGRISGNQPSGTVIKVSFDTDANTNASNSSNAKESTSTSHSSSSGSGVKRTAKTNDWLKLCTINADKNRNLASAFSVERAKLPMTCFIMQGTIVDKVVGHISEVRLRSILYNFLTHYQKEMNVDLMAKSSGKYGETRGTASPLPSAERTDLLGAGANSTYIKEKIYASLVGSEMISLPDEAPHLDGLRRLIQDGKKKAHAELQELYKQLGMDVRKLSDTEMNTHYYKSTQFSTVGVMSALEALFLARQYACMGDISRDNVDWARRSVQKDFAPMLGNSEMRRVLALVDVNQLRGDLTLGLRVVTLERQSIVAALAAMENESNEGGGGGDGKISGANNNGTTTTTTLPPLTSASSFSPSAQLMRQRFSTLQEQLEHGEQLLRIIDEQVDARVLEEAFPTAVVDGLFEDLKANIKNARAASSSSSSSSSEAALAKKKKADMMPGGVSADDRGQNLKTLLMCILQMYPADAKSQMARARLSSLMF